jgi:hypothetical protein
VPGAWRSAVSGMPGPSSRPACRALAVLVQHVGGPVSSGPMFRDDFCAGRILLQLFQRLRRRRRTAHRDRRHHPQSARIPRHGHQEPRTGPRALWAPMCGLALSCRRPAASSWPGTRSRLDPAGSAVSGVMSIWIPHDTRNWTPRRERRSSGCGLWWKLSSGKRSCGESRCGRRTRWRHALLRRRISRIRRIDTLSAGIGSPARRWSATDRGAAHRPAVERSPPQGWPASERNGRHHVGTGSRLHPGISGRLAPESAASPRTCGRGRPGWRLTVAVSPPPARCSASIGHPWEQRGSAEYPAGG